MRYDQSSEYTYVQFLFRFHNFSTASKNSISFLTFTPLVLFCVMGVAGAHLSHYATGRKHPGHVTSPLKISKSGDLCK